MAFARWHSRAAAPGTAGSRRVRRLDPLPEFEQSAGATAAIGPAEPTEAVPHDRLVAGDDRTIELKLQLLDHAEYGDICATPQIVPGIRPRHSRDRVSPIGRRG